MVATPSRVYGAMLGLAVGDAIGAPFEFKSAEVCTAAVEPGLEMTGGGPWLAGEWTDDTAMALALAESLGKRRGFDAEDVASRFISWADSMPRRWSRCVPKPPMNDGAASRAPSRRNPSAAVRGGG